MNYIIKVGATMTVPCTGFGRPLRERRARGWPPTITAPRAGGVLAVPAGRRSGGHKPEHSPADAQRQPSQPALV